MAAGQVNAIVCLPGNQEISLATVSSSSNHRHRHRMCSRKEKSAAALCSPLQSTMHAEIFSDQTLIPSSWAILYKSTYSSVNDIMSHYGIMLLFSNAIQYAYVNGVENDDCSKCPSPPIPVPLLCCVTVRSDNCPNSQRNSQL